MILEINMLIYKKIGLHLYFNFQRTISSQNASLLEESFLFVWFWTKDVVKTLKILYFYEHMLDKTYRLLYILYIENSVVEMTP